MDDFGSQAPPVVVTTIDPAFRSGSLTAVSVVFGFSLSFVTRWAAVPGPWQGLDLSALALITLGIACQTVALASLLSIQSLRLAYYKRSIFIFLTGLAFVAAGVVIAIEGDLIGDGQRILG